jgi:hypothetical protein
MKTTMLQVGRVAAEAALPSLVKTFHIDARIKTPIATARVTVPADLPCGCIGKRGRVREA